MKQHAAYIGSYTDEQRASRSDALLPGGGLADPSNSYFFAAATQEVHDALRLADHRLADTPLGDHPLAAALGHCREKVAVLLEGYQRAVHHDRPITTRQFDDLKVGLDSMRSALIDAEHQAASNARRGR